MKQGQTVHKTAINHERCRQLERQSHLQLFQIKGDIMVSTVKVKDVAKLSTFF